MRKNRIRLTESQLHNVIKESVRSVLNENEENEMALKPIKSGANKGGMTFGKDEWETVFKVYRDLQLIVQRNVEGEIDAQNAMNEIWQGPIYDLRNMFSENTHIPQIRYDLHKGIKYPFGKMW